MTRWPSVGVPVAAVRPAPGNRSFGLTVGGALAALAAFTLWRGHGLRAEILGAVAALLIVAALASPAALGPLARAWGRLGHALGWFNSRVLLTLMFALVFVPVGLVARLSGSDPLGRRRPKGSHWLPYGERFRDPKHYEHPF